MYLLCGGLDIKKCLSRLSSLSAKYIHILEFREFKIRNNILTADKRFPAEGSSTTDHVRHLSPSY